MNHLTVDEIICYVSFNDFDRASLDNAAKVISHIRTCNHCLEKVRAFQMVYDKIMESETNDNVKEITKDFFENTLDKEFLDCNR